MKKCILSAIAGALAMLIAITVMATSHAYKKQTPKEYEHIDYVAAITQEECFVCSGEDAYWGEDNVGLINLNNFDLLYLGINRYDEGGELVQEPAGVMLSCGLTDQESDSYAHACIFPDNAYARLQITGVQYAVDRDTVQNRLCQECLDSINDLWFTDQPPAEYAIISFEDRTIRPLVNAHPWFTAGKFGIDCEFKENGAIDLLVHYLHR